jgi:hypothetical protein
MAVSWNPADKNVGITLSGTGNLTAAGSGATAAWRSVRSTPSFTAGKIYAEVTCGARDSAKGFMFGLMNATASLASFAGSDANGVGFQTDGGIWKTGSNLVVGTDLNGYLVGTTAGVAVDVAAKKIWFYSPQNSLWNNGAIGAQNPATGTGGFDITSLGATLYYGFSAYNSGTGTDTGTLNTGATTFARTPPAGFTGIDGSGGGATVQARAMVLA